MNIKDFNTVLGFQELQPAYEDKPVLGGYTSDLLSDVMAKAERGSALITIQAHRNTVAVSSLVGISAIVICNGRAVPEEMITAAREEGVALFASDKTQFEVSGLLYNALKA